MTIECSQSVHSIDIRPVYYGVQMVICGGKSRFHSVSTWFLGILLCKVKGIGFSNRIRYLAGSFTKTRNRIVKRTGRDPVLSTPCRIRQTALPALSHQFTRAWAVSGNQMCRSCGCKTPEGTLYKHSAVLKKNRKPLLRGASDVPGFSCRRALSIFNFLYLSNGGLFPSIRM